MSDQFVSVDSARLSDLALVGWVGLVIAIVAAVYGVGGIITWLFVGGSVTNYLLGGVFGVLVGGIVAYADATPEYEVACDHCGDFIRVHSHRDGTGEVIKANVSGTPRRLQVGPLSVVLQRCQESYHYCSGECATADETRRNLVGPADLRDMDQPDVPKEDQPPLPDGVEATATDGGTEVET